MFVAQIDSHYARTASLPLEENRPQHILSAAGHGSAAGSRCRCGRYYWWSIHVDVTSQLGHSTLHPKALGWPHRHAGAVHRHTPGILHHRPSSSYPSPPCGIPTRYRHLCRPRIAGVLEGRWYSAALTNHRCVVWSWLMLTTRPPWLPSYITWVTVAHKPAAAVAHRSPSVGLGASVQTTHVILSEPTEHIVELHPRSATSSSARAPRRALHNTSASAPRSPSPHRHTRSGCIAKRHRLRAV